MMKFSRRLHAAHLLGVLLSQHLAGVSVRRPDRIVPVPLHRQRLRARGFNQALEIARPVAGRLGVPLDPWSVRRVRATEPQSDLKSAAERALNVKGAFAVTGNLDTVTHVAVLDDVITTGATTAELVRELKRHGVQQVDVWACAKV